MLIPRIMTSALAAAPSSLKMLAVKDTTCAAVFTARFLVPAATEVALVLTFLEPLDNAFTTSWLAVSTIPPTAPPNFSIRLALATLSSIRVWARESRASLTFLGLREPFTNLSCSARITLFAAAVNLLSMDPAILCLPLSVLTLDSAIRTVGSVSPRAINTGRRELRPMESVNTEPRPKIKFSLSWAA